MIDINELRRVTEDDDAPAPSIEMARAAHYIDWHNLGEDLFDRDLKAELEQTGAKSLKNLGRAAKEKFTSRIKRIRAAGVTEEDAITFAEAFLAAAKRGLEDDGLDPNAGARRETGAQRRARQKAERIAALETGLAK